ncbi:class I SAM-dependent methyltransferase [Vibrio splendidus]|uniref:Methyltransferase domain-containing protein n=1 Tax=Vibrio lentus TaxID=136468 RepID=A0A4U2FZ57_9VIBR|nr:class I SAM-dependent methyltransferase [Vibrio lentus]PHN84025.1 class I SAM-dependent methyltransferase [Vibrio splendidus]MCC4783968.1 class I SAM-dependent methyltransferase [Vibrio lentus]MCC4854269.1 class I SAM-dependent methyltransferase [Vibrio lentus]OMO26973.1 hypothetical protein BH583_18930 [Vibrio lentus]PME62465.1 hypothetical protein BCV33_03860 [Vibrio lentus]
MKTKSKEAPWYSNYFEKCIEDSYWVKETEKEVDFILNLIGESSPLKILDIGCGFGRHSIKLAEHGHDVIGVDINKSLIKNAIESSKNISNLEFFCTNALEMDFDFKFDLVLNLYDGGLGYLENDFENDALFSSCLKFVKKGGYHFTNLWRKEYFSKRKEEKTWQFNGNGLTLTSLYWDEKNSRLIHGGAQIVRGSESEIFDKLSKSSSYRLYEFKDLERILEENDLSIAKTFYGFDNSKSGLKDSERDIILLSRKNVL